jgi:hypothetical protein
MTKLVWEDTRKVQIDWTMMFTEAYDMDGFRYMRSEAETPKGRFMVWPDFIGKGPWNLYGGVDCFFIGDFDTEKDAKAEVERLIS